MIRYRDHPTLPSDNIERLVEHKFGRMSVAEEWRELRFGIDIFVERPYDKFLVGIGDDACVLLDYLYPFGLGA